MAVEMIRDPQEELMKRAAEIRRQVESAQNGPPPMDPKEIAEREEAAAAYLGEDEKFYVDYLADCINTSTEAMKDIREIQDHCYRVYKENEPAVFNRKADWQNRIIIPKPFGTVQYGASAVKKAFTPKFLTVTNTRNKRAGEFWQKVLEIQLNEQHANFAIRFTDATTMGLAVGTSMEMIPRWVPGKGLEYVLIEPWKIHRDPDAMPRDCQSGMYWIHQEWLDWFVLKQGEEAGRYQNVDEVKNLTGENQDNPFLTKEAIAARKAMIWQRSDFRAMILTSEFYGIVVDKRGNVLLPNGTFTDAGGRIISAPKAVQYPHIRWPGCSFSPLPDLLTFNGRGLLEGIVTLWEAMCQIMCLHTDNLMWTVNPMTEIIVDALVDPDDAETWPGKEYRVRETVAGQQAIRTVDRRSITNEVLANLQYADQNFQRGTFVSDAVQGLPGYRKDMTYREAAMNLDQALGVFSLMGENIESGAIQAILAGSDFIAQYATLEDFRQMFSDEELQRFGLIQAPAPPPAGPGSPGIPTEAAAILPTGPEAGGTPPQPGAGGPPAGQPLPGAAPGQPIPIPPMDGSFHISGIQSLMKEQEVLTNLKNVIIPLATNARFAPYIKPYEVLRALEERINIKDENCIVSPEESKTLLTIEAQRGKSKKEEDAKANEIAEAGAMMELLGKMKAARVAEQDAQAQGSDREIDNAKKLMEIIAQMKEMNAGGEGPAPPQE